MSYRAVSYRKSVSYRALSSTGLSPTEELCPTEVICPPQLLYPTGFVLQRICVLQGCIPLRCCVLHRAVPYRGVVPYRGALPPPDFPHPCQSPVPFEMELSSWFLEAPEEQEILCCISFPGSNWLISGGCGSRDEAPYGVEVTVWLPWDWDSHSGNPQLVLLLLGAHLSLALCSGCSQVSCPLHSPPVHPPRGTRSSREGIFIAYIVKVLLKFGCPFAAICPWQLADAEASPPDSQHRSCQSRPHPSSHLTGPRDHLLVGMTSFLHPPKAVPDQTPALSWIPHSCHISVLFLPSPRKKIKIQGLPVSGNNGQKGEQLKRRVVLVDLLGTTRVSVEFLIPKSLPDPI